MRRIRLIEYFYSDEVIDVDFSETPAFRKKYNSCPDRKRHLILEAYAIELEKKIFQESNLNARCYSNLTKARRTESTGIFKKLCWHSY